MSARGRVRLGVVALLVGAALWLGAAIAAAAPVILRTSVSAAERGQTVPRSFLGISTDWPSVLHTVGWSASGQDPIYDRLMSRLAEYGGGMPVLRVGGNFQDNAFWDPTWQKPSNPLLTVPLSPASLQPLAANAAVLGQRMILGINLGADDPNVARGEVRAILRYIPLRDIVSFDIGNEPDEYHITIGYSQLVHGRQVLHKFRGPGWNGRRYLQQFNRIAQAVASVREGLPLSGMDGYGAITTPQRFLERDHNKIVWYTEHTYPLAGCDPDGHAYRPGSPLYPTATRLLGSAGTYGTLGESLRAVAAAKRYRIPVRITEMNSITCTAPPGVASSMAAALWALDQFFLDASIGVQGINFHIDSSSKAPFILYYYKGRWTGLVGPIYYAMVMFAQAVGSDGRLLLYPTFASRSFRGANVRIWGIRGRRGGYRFVVINKDLRRSGIVRIAVPHATSSGTLIRLLAPGIHSHSATLAGQSIPVPTGDGNFRGARVQATVTPHGGTYAFYLPKASAALLSVP